PPEKAVDDLDREEPEDAADREPLRPVAEPAPEALSEQARPSREDEAAGEVERKRHHGLQGAEGERHRRDHRSRRAQPEFQGAGELPGRAAPAPPPEERGAEREISHRQRELPAVVAPGLGLIGVDRVHDTSVARAGGRDYSNAGPHPRGRLAPA